MTAFLGSLSGGMTISVAFLCIMAMLAIGMAIAWHRDRSMEFDLRHMLLDTSTNKMSVEKLGYMTALAISTWGFVALTIEGKLTEWYFTAYMLAFAAARVASQSLSVWKESNSKGQP